MGTRLRGGFATALLLAATTASATVEREDIIMLAPNGRDYNRYQTLRSDRAESVLRLAPDESPSDTLFIVPRDYRSRTLDDGTVQLRFAGGRYAVMRSGRFDGAVQRAENGDFLFSSWNGQPYDGHHPGSWRTTDDFDSFTYSWIVPPNIEILSYSANRNGDWQRSNRTLIWHGEQVNHLAFYIRYRLRSSPARARRTEDTALAIAPAATLEIKPRTKPPSASDPKETGIPGRVRLDDVVALTNGRPAITVRGHALLDRLARTLGHGRARNIRITGPAIDETRDMGASAAQAAQAAQVADYLAARGVEAGDIVSHAGRIDSGHGPRTIVVNVRPAKVIAGFSSGF